MVTQPSHAATGATRLRNLRDRSMAIWPGFLIAVMIALATSFISDHYGGPVMLYALLFGMVLHFVSEDGRVSAGIEFTARTILRFGVALLGARITAEQVAALGVQTVVMVVVGVAATIAFGRLLAKPLGLGRELGMLSGGATAICGVSAAMALSAVMPRNEHSERNLILTVVGVTSLSTVAMVIYPALVTALGLSHSETGVFLGGTIHDVAQVVGAGYMVSSETGEAATVVKLMRVGLLVPAVLVFSFVFRESRAAGASVRPPLLPTFLVAFVVLVILNSTGVIPAVAADAMTEASRWCLVTAIAALGVKTSLQKLAVVGWKPIVLMVGETVFLAILILSAILLLGSSF